MLHLPDVLPKCAYLLVLILLIPHGTSDDAGAHECEPGAHKCEPKSLLQFGSSAIARGSSRSSSGNSSSSNKTVVVIKTYGTWTPWMDFLVSRYGKQLAAISVDLHILHDVSSSEPDQATANLTTYEVKDGSFKAPFCAVTWKAAQPLLAQKPGQSWKADPHIVTTVFETLWWGQCSPRLEGTQQEDQYVWFVEQDAFFNGNLAHFVAAYLNEDADYMARGFRIAGPNWWLTGQFKDALQLGALQTFGVDDDLVKNVWPLPEITETKCNQTVDNNKHGLLFAQDHVTRYSAKFLTMLQDAAAHGIVGPGEAFKATLCASNYGLSEGELCSMTDFAPLRQPSRTGAGVQMDWVSPIYCWVQVAPEPGRTSVYDSEDLPCSPTWQDRWVHPVKLSSPALRLTEC